MTTQRQVHSLEHALTEAAQYVGRTPLLPVRKMFRHRQVTIWAKAEWMQAGGSVKSRAAHAILLDAVRRGLLGAGRRLLDASSGNTGIAYATFASWAGIPFTLCLPENASRDRKELLARLGAEIILTSPFEGTDGAQEMARSLNEAHPEKYYYADQYNNPMNVRAHYHGTATEILEQTGGDLTHFVCGLGTTGSFTGTGTRLREEQPGIRLIALQPDSPMHGMEGWKHLETARVPGIFQPLLADEVIQVDTSVAYEVIRDAYRYEGLMLSPSAAANLAGAMQVAERLDEGKIVTLFADNADRYSEIKSQIFASLR